MNPLQKLISDFMRFPGIGPRQATRFSYYLLRSDHKNVELLLQHIKALRELMQECHECRRFYQPAKRGVAGEMICETCLDPSHDDSILMVVEKDIDLENIKKSSIYNGRYFILGGLIPILTKTPTERVRGKELIEKIERQGKNLREIILALSTNQEGDYTTDFLKKLLAPIAQKYKLSISTLGRGLATGHELEYSDRETLDNALRNRH